MLARTLLSLLFFLASISLATAQQTPIIPQIIVPQPVPTSTVELLGRTGQPVLILTNTNALKSYDVMIGATIVGDNRIQGEIDPRTKRPRFPITLPPGQTRSFTGDELLEVFSNYSIYDINYSGIDLRDLVMNQLFPEGSYVVCVQVYDFNSGDRLSAELTGCTPPIKVRTPDPPIIITPRERERIPRTIGDIITFRWTPVILSQGIANYRIRIADLPSGTNPYDAINDDNLLRWEVDALMAPIFIYDASLPPLPDGKYAVQVTAYDPMGQAAIKNEGRSDVVQFSLHTVLPEPPALRFPYNVSLIPQTEPQNYRFSWRRVNVNGSPLHHDFKLARVPFGISPRNALADPNMLVSEKIGLRSGTHYYRGEQEDLVIDETYAWQVRAYDPDGVYEVENDGLSDIYTFTLGESLLPAPEILSPPENWEHTAPGALTVACEWQHEVSENIEVEYRFSIWEYDGSMSPTRFVSTQNPVFTKQAISGTTYETSVDDFDFGDGGTYLLQVEASDTANERSFANDGKSSIHQITLERLASPRNELNIACGEGCRFELPTGTQGAVDHFVSGDTLRLGNFLIRLTDATTRSGTFYSGEGEIVAGDFFQAPILIRLRGLRFNAEGIAIGGLAESILQSNLGLPSAWTSNLGAIRLPSDPAATLNTLDNNSAPVDQASDETVQLPISINGAHITYLRLLPTTATANIVALHELGGDRVANNKYALFAQKGFCITGAGPAEPASESFLALQEEVTVDRSSNYSITLITNAQGAPFGGTALPFICDGEQPIQAAGYVTLKSEHLSAEGQVLNNNPLYGAFQTTFSDWFDWQTELYLRPIGARGSCCSLGEPVKLQLAELPHYELEVVKWHFDHSAYSNPTELTLPEGSNIASQGQIDQFPGLANLWNGVYFKEAYWHLPRFLRKEDGNTLLMRAQNMVLDDKGMSGQTLLQTADSGIACEIKDWEGNVQQAQIDIQRDQLELADIEVNVELPFFSGNFPLKLENSWTGNGTYWSAEFQDLQATPYSMPAWIAEFTPRPDRCRLTALVQSNGEGLIIATDLSGFLTLEEHVGSITGIQLEGIGVNNMYMTNARSEFSSLPRLQVGSWDIPTGRTLKIADYRVFVSDIHVFDTPADLGVPAGSTLQFEYSFKFDNLHALGQAGIIGFADFEILATQSPNRSAYTLHSTRIDLDPIDWNPMEGIDADGSLNYGLQNGRREFHGQMEIDLVEYRVRVNAQMGRSGAVPYWAFAGEVIPDDAIDLFCGLEARSFGGGIYYNMNKPQSQANGASVTQVNFSPPNIGISRNNYGFMFSTVLTDSETSGDVFNGRFLLEVDLRDEGLDQIRLSGMAHLMDKEVSSNHWINNTEPDKDAAFTVDGEIRFDWPERRLEALAGYRLNFEDGLITGQGDDVVDILIDSRDWHIYLGQDDNRLNAQMNLPGTTVALDAYFMAEGRTNNWRRALENIEIGLRGSLFARSNSYWVPVTVADRIRFSGWLGFDLEGGLGYNTSFCTNHPPNQFFSYISAGLNAGMQVDYYESSRSILPWTLVNDRFNRWERWWGWDFDIDMALYTPNPTGVRLGVGVDIPYWGWENFSITIGSDCE